MTKNNEIEEFRKMSNNQLLEERKKRLVPAVSFILLVVLAYMFVTSMVGCATTMTPSPKNVVQDQVLRNIGFEGDVRIAQMSQDCNSQSAYTERVVKYLLQLKNLPPATTIEVEPRPGSSLCGDMQGVGNNVAMLELGARNLGVFRIVLRWRSIKLRDHERVQKLLWSLAPNTTPAK